MTDRKKNIIHRLLQKYDILSAQDIQDALKNLLDGTIKEMMETEMEGHLGYEKLDWSDNDDYRYGHKSKRLSSSNHSSVSKDRLSTMYRASCVIP